MLLCVTASRRVSGAHIEPVTYFIHDKKCDRLLSSITGFTLGNSFYRRLYTCCFHEKFNSVFSYQHSTEITFQPSFMKILFLMHKSGYRGLIGPDWRQPLAPRPGVVPAPAVVTLHYICVLVRHPARLSQVSREISCCVQVIE